MLSLKLQQAQQLVSSALDYAVANNQKIAIAVTDSYGELLSFAKMDNVSCQAALLAQNKAYTSARDRQTSANLGRWARETGKDISYWNDPRITGFGGGVPIWQDNVCIGAIGISGLSEAQDEQVAEYAISKLMDWEKK